MCALMFVLIAKILIFGRPRAPTSCFLGLLLFVGLLIINTYIPAFALLQL